MSFEFANGLKVSSTTLPEGKHRVLRITDIVADSHITLDFTPKGRDVTIIVEELEIPLSISKVRAFAGRNLFDALIELGWTPPPGDDHG